MGESMKKNIVGFALAVSALLVLALLMSCGFLGTTLPIRNYYMISYTPQLKTSVISQRPYPYSLQVERITVQRIFNNQKIVYRFSPEELQYYDYDQWAVRPEYMFTDLIMKHLEASGIANRIGTEFLDVKPDYSIEASVDAVEKYDATDLFYAHLAMSFKMLRVSDGQQVWEYSFDQRKQVYQKKTVYTVIALSTIMQAQMDSVVTQLDSYFLALKSGISPQPGTPKTVKPAAADTMFVPTNKGYEIIPEQKIRRK